MLELAVAASLDSAGGPGPTPFESGDGAGGSGDPAPMAQPTVGGAGAPPADVGPSPAPGVTFTVAETHAGANPTAEERELAARARRLREEIQARELDLFRVRQHCEQLRGEEWTCALVEHQRQQLLGPRERHAQDLAKDRARDLVCELKLAEELEECRRADVAAARERAELKRALNGMRLGLDMAQIHVW